MFDLINRNFSLAMEGIIQNKMRSFLTALGIIFGVFAVISMMAIGNGSQQAIKEQLELIGTNNIVITAIEPTDKNEDESDDETTGSTEKKEKKSYSPGLSIDDAKSIQSILPNAEYVSLETSEDTRIIYQKKVINSRTLGVNNDFFKINNLETESGNLFSDYQLINGVNVCVLGANLAKKLFLGKDPIGKYIKSDHNILKVIGVLDKRIISKENYDKLGLSNYGNLVFIPMKSFLLRIDDRKRIADKDINKGNRNRKKIENYHQLDKIIVKIQESVDAESSAAVIYNMLKRKHNNQIDYELEVPELLIKQQQDTQSTLNFVFAIIAGISLLVGGIGIMNIMLASVMERIKEIGLRRSIGATRDDIIYQFLLEAIGISLVGGLLGVLLGIVGAKVIASYANIPTVISIWSIFLSFFIAVSVGVVFGILPAQKAAKQDPITALRRD